MLLLGARVCNYGVGDWHVASERHMVSSNTSMVLSVSDSRWKEPQLMPNFLQG